MNHKFKTIGYHRIKVFAMVSENNSRPACISKGKQHRMVQKGGLKKVFY